MKLLTMQMWNCWQCGNEVITAVKVSWWLQKSAKSAEVLLIKKMVAQGRVKMLKFYHSISQIY